MKRSSRYVLMSTLLGSVISMIFVSSVVGAMEEEEVDLARGASLYSENCGRCHNARGPSEFSDAHWPLIVTHMRVIAGLPGEQARAIEAFLRASNNPTPRKRVRSIMATQETVSGDELIKTYGCQGCHRINGMGGTIGPNLGGIFSRQSEDWIRVQIQTPKDHNPKTVMPQFGLSDSQVAAIISVLRKGGSDR